MLKALFSQGVGSLVTVATVGGAASCEPLQSCTAYFSALSIIITKIEGCVHGVQCCSCAAACVHRTGSMSVLAAHAFGYVCSGIQLCKFVDSQGFCTIQSSMSVQLYMFDVWLRSRLVSRACISRRPQGCYRAVVTVFGWLVCVAC